MRLQISLISTKDCLLDYNYNYLIYKEIIKRVEKVDSSLADEIHNMKGPKCFTFSKLFIDERGRHFDSEGIKLLRGTKAKWFFSSARKDLFYSLLESFVNNRNFLENFRIVEAPRILPYDLRKITFDTLSPLRMSKHVNGKIIDLTPRDKEFVPLLEKNLRKKCEKLGVSCDNLSIIFGEFSRIKSKRIKVKDTYHIAFEVKNIKILGSPEVRRVALDCGLGEKNSMGFGMVV